MTADAGLHPRPSCPTLAFVGVTASASSINEVFPRWARVLGLTAVCFEPLDLPLDSDRATYRSVVRRIRENPAYHGALVTSHKVRLMRAAGDLFDDLDRYAELCGEISCIARHGDRLVGQAKDPITSGRALDDLLTVDHFRATGGHAVCLGAGGAGLAIAVHLASVRAHDDRPPQITLVDSDHERLRECRDILAGCGAPVEVIASRSAADNDAAVASAPPGSLIVNATGMGKDRPGSPLTDAAVFPHGAVVWELNYRGDRPFLRHARAQAASASLTVEDGWRYFIHGWSEVISEVFDVDLTPQVLDALSDEAARIRS